MALIARVGIEGCRLYRQSFAGDYMVSAASQSRRVGTLGELPRCLGLCSGR
jgi:hypothetical protein